MGNSYIALDLITVCHRNTEQRGVHSKLETIKTILARCSAFKFQISPNVITKYTLWPLFALVESLSCNGDQLCTDTWTRLQSTGPVLRNVNFHLQWWLAALALARRLTCCAKLMHVLRIVNPANELSHQWFSGFRPGTHSCVAKDLRSGLDAWPTTSTKLGVGIVLRTQPFMTIVSMNIPRVDLFVSKDKPRSF